MNYKNGIIEMIQKINSEKILNLIYWFVKRGYEYDEERAESNGEAQINADAMQESNYRDC